jgi:O-antigen ligase
VAKNQLNPQIEKYIQILLVVLTPILALIAFSGTTAAYWALEPYDGWRILQIISLIGLAIYSLFFQTDKTSLSHNTNRYINIGLPFLIGLIVLSILQAQQVTRAASDAALYGLLAISIWSQANIFRKNPSFAPQIAALLAVLPLLTVIYLPIGIISGLFGSQNPSWHQAFSNIRMLDDALLPCLFLIWQRPAWLAAVKYKKNKFNKFSDILVFTLSTLYVLSLWYDGARAGLLSMIIGLGFIVIFRRNIWISLRLPLLSIMSASLIFYVLSHISVNFSANPISRFGSSGRYELWAKCLNLWQQHPLFGVGGDNFVVSNPWMLNGHPHNTLLQLVSEYGIAGLIIIFLLVPLATQIFKHLKVMPLFAIAAVVAVMFDSLCSGVLVYPLSQTLGLWALAWIISLLPTHSINFKQSVQYIPSDSLDQRPIYNVWHSMIKIIALLSIAAMLYCHGRDLICFKCTSVDANNAPRFWQYGRALHLTP